MQPLGNEVRDRLIDELGEHGCRAVEFLDTAAALLDGRSSSATRHGQAVAFCLRQAIRAISEAAGAGDPGTWGRLSRDVVDACEQYRRVRGMSSDDERALDDLLAKVGELKRFHDQQRGFHERGLSRVMADVTGVAPVVVVAGPMESFQRLLGRLNAAVYSGRADVDAERLWKDCVEVLRRLFLPPEVRISELERLAGLDNPTEQDRDAAVDLLASSEHLRRFLNAVVSPSWLGLLTESGHLVPPNNGGSWPVLSAVRRLTESHPQEVVSWLEGLAREHQSDSVRARCIARAASVAGEPAVAVVLEIVKEHQQDPDVLSVGLYAVDQLSSCDVRVEVLADIVLNEHIWSQVTWPDPVLRQLEDGVTAENASGRVVLLCHKIRTVPDGDYGLSFLRHDPAGSVAEGDVGLAGDRFGALLSCLLAIVAQSWDWMEVSDLLELVQHLPDGLRQRVRAWILAQAPQVAAEACIEEIFGAIGSRRPTGDDLALVDRTVNDLDASGYAHRWAAALGEAPSITEMGEALRTLEVSDHWERAARWASLLPRQARGMWSAPSEILASLDGPTRQQLERRRGASISDVGSPLSIDDLLAVDVTQAARMVANWRPAAGDWPGRARHLAQAVGSAVERDPDRWLSAPLEIVSALRHPRYISQYLHAVANLVDQHDLPIHELVDAVVFVRCRPWSVEPGTQDGFGDSDPWRHAEDAAIRLVEALARTGCMFDDRRDEVWELLESEAMNCPPRPEPPADGSRDLYTAAINRSCTRALQAMLWLLRNEYLETGEIHPSSVRVIEASLRLAGDDGAEHRAVIAVWFGILRHALGDWTESNRDLLFGNDAPLGLGQSMFDETIEHNQPNDWLLENFPEMLHDAVQRGVARAIDHLMVAMLWELAQYSVQDVVNFVSRAPALMSEAGHRLARVMTHSPVEQRYAEIAVDFWDAALDAVPAFGAAAGDALQGFGWFSEVEPIDTRVWSQITLKTLTATGGRIDWAPRVAQRVAASAPSPTGLSVLDQLVRCSPSDWERRKVAEHARPVLASAQHLENTVEYRRLRTALVERGLLE